MNHMFLWEDDYVNYLERTGIIKIVDDIEDNLRFVGFSLEAYRDTDHFVYKHQLNRKIYMDVMEKMLKIAIDTFEELKNALEQISDE